MDIPPEKKYRSVNTKTFKDQACVKGRTAAKTVGVNKQEDQYKKPIPPEVTYKFYNISPQEQDETVEQESLKRDAKAFFGTTDEPYHKDRVVRNTEEQNINAFFNDDAEPIEKIIKKEKTKLGDPIPNYSGVTRRVQADNVFGMTYAEACRRAKESQQRVENEKGETLKMTSTYLPDYKRPKPDDEFI